MHTIKEVARVEQDIRELIDGTARLWDFTASHDMLVIWMRGVGGAPERYLVLCGCNKIELPVMWTLTNPRFVVALPLIDFMDDNVRVICQDVSLHDHYRRTA